MAELLPCPFCAGTNWSIVGDNRSSGLSVSYQYECMQCRARGPLVPVMENAAKAWNTRAPSPATAALREAAKGAYNFMMNHQGSFGIEEGSPDEFDTVKLLRAALAAEEKADG